MTVGWGILGTGRIAALFAGGIAGSETGRLVAVGSRDQEAADAFAERHGGRGHGSYDAVLADEAVDAVYIALPNHLHLDWTIRCAEAGKHVLCEKPLALNAVQALQAFEVCRAHGVFCMEGFMYRCHPQTWTLRRLLADGVIGDVRVVQADFGYAASDIGIRDVNAWGGGAIMDVGCYCTSMARLVAGAPAVAISGAAHLDPTTRVDHWATAVVRYANDVTAVLSCAGRVRLGGQVRIYADKGTMIVPSPWHPGREGASIHVHPEQDEPQIVEVPAARGLYALEADAVGRSLQDGEAPEMPWSETLENMRTLDGWRASVGLRFNGEGKRAPIHAPRPEERRMSYIEVDGVSEPLSRLVLGTMVMQPGQLSLTDELMDGFVAAGGTTIDTARIYGTESVVGLWLQLSGIRDRLVVIGKGCGPGRVRPEYLAEELQQSLEAMRLEYFDLYLLHRDDPNVPVGELIDALNEHARAGRIRAFGASNWTTRRLREANAYAEANGLLGFVVSSPNLSLATQNEEAWPGTVSISDQPQELRWYKAEQLPVLSWSSQARGFFTARTHPEDRSDSELVRVWYSDANWERKRRAAELGARLGATANQVALAWVLHQPFPTAALIGPATAEEAQDSYGALRLELTAEQVAWLNLERDQP
jgi:predicted dehydrogenase/aryl-alcohol dehydrogenase-like predicted oxidoreductase